MEMTGVRTWETLWEVHTREKITEKTELKILTVHSVSFSESQTTLINKTSNFQDSQENTRKTFYSSLHSDYTTLYISEMQIIHINVT